MNKIVITILSVALGFISCKDDSTGEISKSDKLVLQIEAAGIDNVYIDFDQNKDKYSRIFTVAKKNKTLKEPTTAKLEVLTQRELENEYGPEYMALPETAYVLDTKSVSIAAEDLRKSVQVTFFTDKVVKAIGSDVNATYALGIKLVSDNAGIDSESCLMLYTISVERRKVGLQIDGKSVENIEMSSGTSEYKQLISISKGGEEKDKNVQAEILVLTQNEFDDEYIAAETNYKLLPEGTYKFTPTVLSFSPDEITKTTELTLIADEIIKVMAENESETVWALAVKLLSYDGEVNPEKESKLFTISYDPRPKISLKGTEDTTPEQIIMPYKTGARHTLTAAVNVELNKLTFSCTINTTESIWVEEVKKYNADNDTSYEMLPVSAIGVENFDFIPGQNEASAEMIINGSELEEGKVYLLPLMLNQLSTEEICTSNEVTYILVQNPKYELRNVGQEDKNAMKILYCNSECLINHPDIDPSNEWDYHPVTGILNGIGWTSAYDGKYRRDFSNGDDYDYDHMAGKEWHTFLGFRPNLAGQTFTEGVAIVIDLGRTMRIAEIGFQQGFGKYNDSEWMQRVRNFDVSISQDEEFLFQTFREVGNLNDYFNPSRNNWVKILSVVDAPRISDKQWHNVSEELIESGASEGRLLKLHFSGSWTNEISMTDLSFREIAIVE